jgi:choline kinase
MSGADLQKALLELGGRTLLDRHLENLRGTETLVVTGFKGERIKAPWTVHNERFALGSVTSLGVAVHAFAERAADLLVLDADVLYEPSILRDVAALRRGFALDERTKPTGEEMMLGVRDGVVRTVQRGVLEGWDLVRETVGFTKIDSAAVPLLTKAIGRADPSADYESALDELVAEIGADFVPVGSRPWVEIDFMADLERADRDILPHVESVAS